MSQLFKNNARSKLAAAVALDDLTLTVATGEGARFPVLAPGDFFIATIQDATNIEIVKVTARNTDIFTIVRAQEGTNQPALFASGTAISLRLTAAPLNTAVAHAAVSVDAHTASAITSLPAGNLVATNVQAALYELDAEKELLGTAAAAVAAHVAAVDPHTQYATDTDLTNAMATKLSLTGGTMSGPITLAANASLAMHPVTKQQYDLKVSKGGDTMTGDLSIINGTTEMHLFLGSSGAYLYGNTTKYGIWKQNGGNFYFDVGTGDGYFSGNITAFSDAKLKTNLAPIGDALAKVRALTGYTYTRIDTGERQTGLIAQDVQQVLPEAVVDTGENLALAYGNLVGLLVEAIKEQQLQIIALRDEITNPGGV